MSNVASLENCKRLYELFDTQPEDYTDYNDTGIDPDDTELL